MTNEEQVRRWHKDRPAWTKGYKARDWDTADEIARKLDLVEAQRTAAQRRQ